MCKFLINVSSLSFSLNTRLVYHCTNMTDCAKIFYYLRTNDEPLLGVITCLFSLESIEFLKFRLLIVKLFFIYIKLYWHICLESQGLSRRLTLKFHVITILLSLSVLHLNANDVLACKIVFWLQCIFGCFFFRIHSVQSILVMRNGLWVWNTPDGASSLWPLLSYLPPCLFSSS